MGLDDIISQYSLKAVFFGSILLLILIAISLKIKPLSSKPKVILFTLIVSVVALVTLFLGASTIYLNTVSASKGPVHFHADFEIWNCGTEVELKDPTGFSNKIGTPTLHEHNDKRIHLEGVVVGKNDASLGKFFSAVGGYVTPSSLSLPTNNGQLTLTSPGKCQEGNTAFLQVFVYKVLNGYYYQTKIENPQDYVIASQTNVPPGDCIIIEFDSLKNRTDKLCRSYRAAEITGKIKGAKYGN